MPNLKQNVFIDDTSSDSSSNGCGWLLDDSSSCGIHVMISYLLRCSGAKIAVPNSIDLKKSHNLSSDLLDTDESDGCSSIISLSGLLGTKIHVTVTIHNGPEETPLKSYACLIRAKKVSVSGSSTFCTLPVLVNREGIGFIFRTKKHNPLAVKAATKYDKIMTWKVPRLAKHLISRLNNMQILRWLRNQDAQAGEHIIGEEPLIPPRLPGTKSVIQ